MAKQGRGQKRTVPPKRQLLSVPSDWLEKLQLFKVCEKSVTLSAGDTNDNNISNSYAARSSPPSSNQTGSKNC